jgi:hypothetical protein
MNRIKGNWKNIQWIERAGFKKKRLEEEYSFLWTNIKLELYKMIQKVIFDCEVDFDQYIRGFNCWPCLALDKWYLFRKISKSNLIFQNSDVSRLYTITLLLLLFYANYIRISTTTSTKQLMKIFENKTVQYYVYYNLIMIAYSMVVGFIIAFTFSPEIDSLKKRLASTRLWLLLLVYCFYCVLILGIFWLFYRLLYGTYCEICQLQNWRK